MNMHESGSELVTHRTEMLLLAILVHFILESAYIGMGLSHQIRL